MIESTHTILHRIWISWIGYSSTALFRVEDTPFPSVELEYMFDTLGFLWFHHGCPPYLLYLLEKLVDGLSGERMKPQRSTTTTTTTTTTATTATTTSTL